MVIKEHVEINTSLSIVWSVFSSLEDWKDWNSVCQNCRINQGGGMAVDTCFSFTLRPYYFPLKVSPRIIEFEPGRRVVMEGSRLGIRAVHSYSFREEASKVIVISIEKCRGPLFVLSRTLFIPSKLRRLTRKLLIDFKYAAESRSKNIGT